MNETDTSNVLPSEVDLSQAEMDSALDLPRMDDALDTLEVQASDRPFLTTSFQEYNVTEGLLLTLVLLAYIVLIVKLVKEAFSWL